MKEEAFLLSHTGLGDSIISISIANYLSYRYKKVWFVCKEKYVSNLRELICKSNIELFIVNEDVNISPMYGFDLVRFKNITCNMDVFLCGTHRFDNPNIDNFPLGFYDDLCLDRKVFWEFFEVKKPTENKILYEMIKDKAYIVVHNIASTGKAFDTKSIIEKYAEPDLLIINFVQNEYNPTDKYYELAQNFVYKPLAHYQDVIINAKYIFLTDSSLFCLALHLPIKTRKCYFLPRTNYPYELIYYDKIFNEDKNVKFKRIV